MAILNPATTLPSSSRDALEQWDERYIASQQLAVPQTWVNELGDEMPTGSLETKYPMAMLALKYVESRETEPNFEQIGEKSCDLVVAEYKAGVAIELMKVLTNTFSASKWASSPAQFLQAEAIFKLKLIAAALEANTETCGWDDLALFHDSHLANPKDASKGTFDNLQASAKDCADLANIEAEFTLMKEVPDINGDVLNIQPDAIGVPRQKFQKLKNLLKQDFVPSAAGTATMRNPYNDNSILVIEMKQLTDVNDWYIFDTQLLKSIPPWILAKLLLPVPGFDALSLRRHDEQSEMFRNTGKIGVDSRIFYGSKFLFPHAIRKVAGA